MQKNQKVKKVPICNAQAKILRGLYSFAFILELVFMNAKAFLPARCFIDDFTAYAVSVWMGYAILQLR